MSPGAAQLSPADERYPSDSLIDAPQGMPSAASSASSVVGMMLDDDDRMPTGLAAVFESPMDGDQRSVDGGGFQHQLRGPGTTSGLDNVVDLASFAASVASGAAHLTLLSSEDSPPDHRPTSSGSGLPPLQLVTSSTTAASGPQFVAADFLSPDEFISASGLFDVRPHNLHYSSPQHHLHYHHQQQHQVQQLQQGHPSLVLPPPPPPPVLPPASAVLESEDAAGGTAGQLGAGVIGGEWSLRADLSPIIDVSPSVERIEQV